MLFSESYFFCICRNKVAKGYLSTYIYRNPDLSRKLLPRILHHSISFSVLPHSPDISLESSTHCDRIEQAMLLKSSSSPVLSSLVTSLSESPVSDHHVPMQKHTHTSISHNHLSFLKTGSCNNLPKPLFRSASSAEINGTSSTFRRVYSEGNLEELAGASESPLANKLPRKISVRTLDTIPSFAEYLSATPVEDNEDTEDNIQVIFREKNRLEMASFIGGGGNRGHGGNSRRFDGDGEGNSSGLEEHYKRMLGGDPENPLFLRNYAHFLYEEKGDLERAEEYYSRAILANPEDGEILTQYAKLTLQLHQDHEKANQYFERAVQTSPQDSHVQAAYASFLWDMNEEEDESSQIAYSSMQHGVMAATA